MNPISVPFDPAQPAGEAIYPVAELYTFQVFASRAQYASVYGQDPPPYDPNKREKRWFDSTVDLSDPNGFGNLHGLAAKSDGSYKREAIGMTTSEAAVPNILPDDTKWCPSLQRFDRGKCPPVICFRMKYSRLIRSVD